MDRIARLDAAFGGTYRVERELGAGGMATVYLAEDVKHHRKVAIKVLREDLSASVGVERFLREIEIAAHLQHPNILPLLDSGEAGGHLYYVMPFVEGQSLRQRLTREHELPIHEAVRLLTEIVDALAYAHERGVVHRDIKPDNIMLSGRHGLIADFGVARALSEATGSDKITSLGVALGTPSYMSPEQATADPMVDHRTDIYAVGILGYELIAGQLPFSVGSPQKMLAAHVMEAPDALSKHRAGVSPALEHAIMHCLEKRPADRWQSAAELLAALEPLATPSAGMAPTSARLEPVVIAPHRWRRTVGLGLAFLAVVGALAVVIRMRTVSPTLSLGASTQLTTETGLQIHPSISPDGKFIAYASGTSRRMRIFIRPVGGGRVIPLSDDSTALQTNPRWSPDGTQLLALANGGVSIAPALGGSMRPVVAPSARARVRTADWSPDGREVVFAREDSLLVQSVSGSPPRFLGSMEELHECRWSPRGNLVACVAGNSEGTRPGAGFGNIAPSALVLFPTDAAAPRALTDRNSVHLSPTWSSDGSRLYFISDHEGTRDIYEIALDGSGKARGPAMRITTGLNAYSLSLAGQHVAYSVYGARANIWTVPIPKGSPASAESARQLSNGTQIVEYVEPTRDGKWLLFDATRSGRSDIYRMPVNGGQEEQLVHGNFDVFAPDLSPDGKLLAYHSWRTGNRDIEVKPLDGGPVEIVTNSPAQESYPTWSPDGHQLAFYDQAQRRSFVVRRDGPGKWGTPTELGSGIRPTWLSDTEVVVVAADTSTIVARNVTSRRERTLYTLHDGASANGPAPESIVVSADGKIIYLKSHDAAGHASFWSMDAAGGKPKLLVTFPNLDRRSNRRDFGVDASRFYFTFEDQQSNIWIADVKAP